METIQLQSNVEIVKTLLILTIVTPEGSWPDYKLVEMFVISLPSECKYVDLFAQFVPDHSAGY